MNELWRHYLEAVRQVRPLAFLIENVKLIDRWLADYDANECH